MVKEVEQPPYFRTFAHERYLLMSFGKSRQATDTAAKDLKRLRRGKVKMRIVRHKYRSGTVVWCLYAK